MNAVRESIHVGGFAIELRRSARRKTMSLTVDRHGEVIAHAPAPTERKEIERWINTRLLWLHQKVTAKEAIQPLPKPAEFVTGESIFYLGKSFRLKVMNDGTRGLRLQGERFLLGGAVADPETTFRRWFVARGKEVLRQRVAHFQRRLLCHPTDLAVRELGYRWGSCSPKGKLLFNWRLMQLPMRLIDYIVAHELTHLVVPNHSSEFWDKLAEIQPDCQERRRKIDEQGAQFLRFSMR